MLAEEYYTAFMKSGRAGQSRKAEAETIHSPSGKVMESKEAQKEKAQSSTRQTWEGRETKGRDRQEEKAEARITLNSSGKRR